jgi:hypothetical protein
LKLEVKRGDVPAVKWGERKPLQEVTAPVHKYTTHTELLHNLVALPKVLPPAFGQARVFLWMVTGAVETTRQFIVGLNVENA